MTDLPPSPENNSGFVKKTIETPVMDSESKARLTLENSNPGGFKGFYRANRIYFWAIILGVGVIGVLSYFAFHSSPKTAPKQANVAINIDVPPTVSAGGEAVYKITVQNNDTQKLVSMQLELTYDNGIAFESSSPNPQDLSGTTFNVPDLIPGQNATVFVKTKVNGNVNDQKNLDVKLHYHYSNFSSEFVADQTAMVRLQASNVVLELQGPQTANNGQLVVYTISYQNNSDAPLSSARVQITYPNGFTFASASPPPDLGNNTWNLSSVAQGATGKIQIQGTFNAVTPGQSVTASAEFLLLGQDGQYYSQNSRNFTSSISSLPLVVTQSLQQNGNSTTTVVNPGDNLNFNVTYQNNSQTPVSGVNVEVDLSSKAINASTIRAQGAQINNNTIIWNASGVPALQNLSPNQSGQLSFSLTLNNPATKDSSKNLTVVSDIKMSSNEFSSAFPGNEITLKISSPASIGKNLQFISGQLPPRVGQETDYKVTLSLTNSSNDFSTGVLTASIPPGEFVANSFSDISNTKYDSSTGKLTWNFGTLPANTGRFTAPKSLSFEVKISPSSGQVGQEVSLVKNISFTATDLFTGQNVSASTQDVTTNDLSGQSGFGNGQVQQ